MTIVHHSSSTLGSKGRALTSPPWIGLAHLAKMNLAEMILLILSIDLGGPGVVQAEWMINALVAGTVI